MGGRGKGHFKADFIPMLGEEAGALAAGRKMSEKAVE